MGKKSHLAVKGNHNQLNREVKGKQSFSFSALIPSDNHGSEITRVLMKEFGQTSVNMGSERARWLRTASRSEETQCLLSISPGI